MLSIDVGYGNVKVYDGEDVIAFPSVYEVAADSYSPKTDPTDQLLEVDGVKYHVGLTALNMAGVAPFDKEDMLRHKIFMLSAICEASDSKNFSDSVALGLPIGDYDIMADKLKKLKGTYEVKYNGKKRTIEITKISVYAQSEAVFEMLEKQVGDLRKKTVGIIDIGQKTVDYAYFQFGTYLRKFSGSMEQGVINAYQDIVDALEREGYSNIDDYQARRYLDVVPEDSQEAFKKLAGAIRQRLIRRHWNLPKMEIYIVGGGTSYIAPYFQDVPYQPIEEETAVFANAYGYYEAEKG